MEADWSVEIGADEPYIDASWDGRIDLRASASMIHTLQEARHAALRNALLNLNSLQSGLFTTKCDIWTLAKNEIDPDEFGAERETAKIGFASYIDILERSSARFESFVYHEALIRNLTAHLRQIELTNGRVDIVLRAAADGGRQGFGLTVYSAGCGADHAEAYAAWEAVLEVSVPVTMEAAAHPSRLGE